MCTNFDLNKFLQNAVSTVALCNHIINQSLAQKGLWETISKKSEYIESLSSRDLSELTETGRRELAGKVFEVRADLISQESIVINNSKPIPDLRSGELLAFFPTETFNDGTAELLTDGYFNYFNWPPFSTWIYYVAERSISEPETPHLICWIPPDFVDLAADGIDLSPDLSLARLDSEDLNACYKPILIEAGLLRK